MEKIPQNLPVLAIRTTLWVYEHLLPNGAKMIIIVPHRVATAHIHMMGPPHGSDEEQHSKQRDMACKSFVCIVEQRNAMTVRVHNSTAKPSAM